MNAPLPTTIAHFPSVERAVAALDPIDPVYAIHPEKFRAAAAEFLGMNRIDRIDGIKRADGALKPTGSGQWWWAGARSCHLLRQWARRAIKNGLPKLGPCGLRWLQNQLRPPPAGREGAFASAGFVSGSPRNLLPGIRRRTP